MNTFIISYELNSKRKYQSFFLLLSEFGAHELLPSVWEVKTLIPIKDLYKLLDEELDHDDRLFVCARGNYVGRNMVENAKKNLKNE